MHPIEHLYYYACVLPSLVFYCSPFALLWNGVHLLLSPGASHSGYEDHFQADAFHYMHHRYFECNYAGFSAGFLDVMMGTFTPSMEARDKGGAKMRDDKKSTLRAVPTAEFLCYLLLAAGSVAAWAHAALRSAAGLLVVSTQQALALAALAGFGPVVLAVVVTACAKGDGGTSFKGLASVVQLALGTLFCAVPVSWACLLAISPP
jgi:hypothetical protein